MNGPSAPWWRELNRYHWFVLIVAALGWLFDCLDQQLFLLARQPAMSELLAPAPGVPADPAQVREASGDATAIFLMGWAIGGLVFGVLGDRYGRAKIMMWTILIYSICTGLNAVAMDFWTFAIFRFLTGLGVGGEFAVGVALVAEVMPDRARPFALGTLQALSAVGNISAAFINMSLAHLEDVGALDDLLVMGHPVQAWRIMFVVGAVPALLAIVIRSRLKEPERWRQQIAAGERAKKAGSYAELFGDPRWRKSAFVGLALAFAGVVGLWGIGFFSFDLLKGVFKTHFLEAGLDEAAAEARAKYWVGMNSVAQNIGGFLGIWFFSRLTHIVGRKPAFALCFLAALGSTAYTFAAVDASTVEIAGVTVFDDILWMTPLMGFWQLSLFGGYAIYLPELFPTRLRSTGTSFCYNVGRFVAALGPVALTQLSTKVYGGLPGVDPWRYAGVTMCAVFLIGLFALPFAPETKGKPLPE